MIVERVIVFVAKNTHSLAREAERKYGHLELLIDSFDNETG